MLDIFLPGIIHTSEDHALRQQVVQKLCKLQKVSAGVIAHIENQRLCPLPFQLLNGFYGFLGTVFIKVCYGYKPDIFAQHLTGCHRHTDGASGQRERKGFSVPEDRNGNIRSRLAPDQFPCALRT